MWLEWDDESSSKGKLFPKLPIFAPSFMLKTVAAMAWHFFFVGCTDLEQADKIRQVRVSTVCQVQTCSLPSGCRW